MTPTKQATRARDPRTLTSCPPRIRRMRLAGRPLAGTSAQQRPALELGHAAPDTVRLPGIESIFEALGPHGAAVAHRLGGVFPVTLLLDGLGVLGAEEQGGIHAFAFGKILPA